MPARVSPAIPQRSSSPTTFVALVEQVRPGIVLWPLTTTPLLELAIQQHAHGLQQRLLPLRHAQVVVTLSIAILLPTLLTERVFAPRVLRLARPPNFTPATIRRHVMSGLLTSLTARVVAVPDDYLTVLGRSTPLPQQLHVPPGFEISRLSLPA